MEIKTTIKGVEPEELYDYIRYIVAKQIQNMYGESDEIDLSVIKPGYSHKTTAMNAGKQNKARYTIRKAVPGKLFESSYTTGERSTVTTYKLSPASKGTELLYTSETMMFNGKKIKEGQFLGIPDAWNRFRMKLSLKNAVRRLKRSRS